MFIFLEPPNLVLVSELEAIKKAEEDKEKARKKAEKKAEKEKRKKMMEQIAAERREQEEAERQASKEEKVQTAGGYWVLTHWGRMTHICITNFGHHWFR